MLGQMSWPLGGASTRRAVGNLKVYTVWAGCVRGSAQKSVLELGV